MMTDEQRADPKYAGITDEEVQRFLTTMLSECRLTEKLDETGKRADLLIEFSGRLPIFDDQGFGMTLLRMWRMIEAMSEGQIKGWLADSLGSGVDRMLCERRERAADA